MRLQGFTVGCNGKQEGTEGYKGLEEGTRVRFSVGYNGETGGYRRLQRVR